MSQSKHAYLSFVSAALLATSIIHGLNPTKIDAASPKAISNTASKESRSPIIFTQADLSQIDSGQTTEVLSDNSVADRADRSSVITDENESKLRLARLISLTFFLLFFVPFGIFYPLFLFYRMLLIKPDESKNVDGVNGILALDEVEPSTTTNSAKLALPSERKLNKATVSKLQIAFSPTASQLREQLSKIGSDTNVNIEYDLVDLMHQTVAVLIDLNHWTHVSYDSTTLPLDKIRAQFDSISQQERKKIANQQANISYYNRNNINHEGHERKYSYVVVTLILCTSHATPLFQRIDTKKQLLEELVQLSKMQEHSLIRFELLWNPQQQKEYITNDRLLIDYGDMTRLL